MPRRNWAPAVSLLALALLTPGAHGLFDRPIPLREVLASEPMIFVVRVEKFYPEKPAAILKVTESLKGKAPFEQLPVNLTTDNPKKEDETPQLVKRLAADLSL